MAHRVYIAAPITEGHQLLNTDAGAVRMECSSCGHQSVHRRHLGLAALLEPYADADTRGFMDNNQRGSDAGAGTSTAGRLSDHDPCYW